MERVSWLIAMGIPLTLGAATHLGCGWYGAALRYRHYRRALYAMVRP